MGLAVLWIFFCLMGSVYMGSQLADPEASSQDRVALTTYIMYMLIAALYSLVLITGAFSMIRTGSYAWAVVTCLLALDQFFTPCYVLGIPIGVWGLIVMRDPAVRSEFQKL